MLNSRHYHQKLNVILIAFKTPPISHSNIIFLTSSSARKRIDIEVMLKYRISRHGHQLHFCAWPPRRHQKRTCDTYHRQMIATGSLRDNRQIVRHHRSLTHRKRACRMSAAYKQYGEMYHVCVGAIMSHRHRASVGAKTGQTVVGTASIDYQRLSRLSPRDYIHRIAHHR